MNLPNKLAMLRMILIIPFVLIIQVALSTDNLSLEIFTRLIATIIFVGAAITDYFDGKIARKYNMITNLGKLIDPLADKLLVISAMVVFTKYDRLSFWIVLIFRELLITGLRSIVAAEGVVSAAETLGKWKTTTQMIALTIMILLPTSGIVNNILMLITLVLTIQSGVEYVMKSKEILIK